MKSMKTILGAAALALSSSALAAGEGVVSKPSPYPVRETLDRLEKVLAAKNVKVFARIDHAAEAKGAGLAMRPAQLLVFGNPKAGTPVMTAAPTAAIDLPLKTLAWEDAGGKVWLSYNDASYLGRRHSVPEDLMKPIAGAAALIDLALK